MSIISLGSFSINRFWEKTPTVLKYILTFSIIIATSYFFFSKRLDSNYVRDLETMRIGIDATYELIGNFEEFRREQDRYNKEILAYLNNLHILVEDLNTTTNRKLDMILSAGGQNAQEIIEKIMLLNESFEKLSRAYQPNIERPDLNNNRVNLTPEQRTQFEIGVRSARDTIK